MSLRNSPPIALRESAWEQELRETLRELINLGASSPEGLSIILTLRFRWLFGRSSSIFLQSFQGPFGRGVISVHQVAAKYEPHPEREGYWNESIKTVVGDAKCDGDVFLDQFVLALRAEPGLQKMRLHFRIKDWLNRTMTTFLLKFANESLKLVLLDNRGAPLKWEAATGRGSN